MLLAIWLALSTALAEDPTIPLVRYSELAEGRPDTLDEGFVTAYETSAGNTISVGDTLVLGTASGSSAHATGNGFSATAVRSQYFANIYNGTYSASVGKATMAGLSGDVDPSLFMAPASLGGLEVKVQRIKLAGSRKHPVIWMECELVDQAQRANGSGIVTIWDYEVASRLSEVFDPDYVPREVAIAKLKEAKELFDMGVYSQDQFDAEKAKYAPFVTAP